MIYDCGPYAKGVAVKRDPNKRDPNKRSWITQEDRAHSTAFVVEADEE